MTASSPRQPPPVPDYELLRCIGRGSYGDVWLARNVLGDLRAVKFVYRDRFADARPFEREFEGIERFEPISRSHPSQLHILHVGKNESAGCFYYVMELADDGSDQFRVTSDESKGGPARHSSLVTPNSYSPRTLRADLERYGRLPVSECIEIGISLATALRHLHERGLVHRDIKPSNVIFVNGVAKLGDIGLVTDAGDTQSIVGTEGYLPPEGPGTSQADIYSLGMVLYELSTGMDRRRFAELPANIWEWPDRKQVMEFNEIILGACETSVSKRYASAEVLLGDLSLLAKGRSIRSRKAITRRMHRAAAFVLLILLAAGAVAMQRALSHRTADQLVLATHEGMRPSTNREAMDLFNLGLYSTRKYSGSTRRESIELFQRAIEKDPSFAAAYGMLASVYTVTVGEFQNDMRKARQYCEKALQLDPNDANALNTMGFIRYIVDWDWNVSGLLRRSVELAPHNGEIRMTYGIVLMDMGRFEQAIPELERAQALDPLALIYREILGMAYFHSGQLQRGIHELEQVIAIEPRNTSFAYEKLPWFYAYAGEFEKAIATAGQSERLLGVETNAITRHQTELSAAYRSRGREGYWQWHLDRAIRHKNSFEQACACAMLGRTNEAIAAVRAVCDERSEYVPKALLRDIHLQSIRDDPRFAEILRRVGLKSKAE